MLNFQLGAVDKETKKSPFILPLFYATTKKEAMFALWSKANKKENPL